MVASGLWVGSILKRSAEPRIYTSGTSAEKVSPISSNHTINVYNEADYLYKHRIRPHRSIFNYNVWRFECNTTNFGIITC